MRGTSVGRHEQGMGALWLDVVMALGWHRFPEFWRDFASDFDAFAYNCTMLLSVPTGSGGRWPGRCAYTGTLAVCPGPDGRTVCPSGHVPWVQASGAPSAVGLLFIL